MSNKPITFNLVKFSLALLFIVGLNTNSTAQYDSVLAYQPNGMKYRFYYMGVRIDGKVIEELVKPNRKARNMVVKGRVNAVFGGIFGYVGGVIVGWQIGNFVFNGGDSPIIVSNPVSLGIGTGCIVTSLIINHRSNKQIYKGVKIWNEYIKSTYGDSVSLDTSSSIIDVYYNQAPEKPKAPEISDEEYVINELKQRDNLEYAVYLRLDEVEIGDYVFFNSPFGERIYGVVLFKEKSNGIKINTFPTAGNVLVQEVKIDQLRKIKIPTDYNGSGKQ